MFSAVSCLGFFRFSWNVIIFFDVIVLVSIAFISIWGITANIAMIHENTPPSKYGTDTKPIRHLIDNHLVLTTLRGQIIELPITTPLAGWIIRLAIATRPGSCHFPQIIYFAHGCILNICILVNAPMLPYWVMSCPSANARTVESISEVRLFKKKLADFCTEMERCDTDIRYLFSEFFSECVTFI